MNFTELYKPRYSLEDVNKLCKEREAKNQRLIVRIKSIKEEFSKINNEVMENKRKNENGIFLRVEQIQCLIELKKGIAQYIHAVNELHKFSKETPPSSVSTFSWVEDLKLDIESMLENAKKINETAEFVDDAITSIYEAENEDLSDEEEEEES